MRLSKPTIFIAIILSISLFIVGYLTTDSVYELLLPVVGEVSYYETSIVRPFWSSVSFAVILALIPIFLIAIWKVAPVITPAKRALTVAIVVACLALSVFARREMIKSRATTLQRFAGGEYTDQGKLQPAIYLMGIPADTLRFELFAFAGLLAGSIIAIFSLRETNVIDNRQV
jgi:hypothetical protein